MSTNILNAGIEKLVLVLAVRLHLLAQQFPVSSGDVARRDRALTAPCQPNTIGTSAQLVKGLNPGPGEYVDGEQGNPGRRDDADSALSLQALIWMGRTREEVKMMIWKVLGISTIWATLAAGSPLVAQVQTEVPPIVPGAKPVTVERIRIHGLALEGNLEGNEVERDVFVFLPPGYAKQTSRRYPVLYALHGYSIGADQWTQELHVPQTIEGAFALGSDEMIVVLPDSKTVHNGSMYSSSVTTGDFERFIVHDVVQYIDAHYRTLPDRESRGLAGHSMGGYGATRLGIKHPDVFGSLYIMSPCCLSARRAERLSPEDEKALEAVKTAKDSAALPFFQRAQLATAAAWSPNPKNPPLYLDLPTKDGEVQPAIVAKWAANAPLAFIDQYVSHLRRYRAIAIDVGDQDRLRFDSQKLHEALETYGIEHSFEIYEGTHTSKVADRFQNHVIPFFSRALRGFTSDR